MRIFFDFGLLIRRADISTDGTWCFLVLVVALSSNGVLPHWPLLKSRLQEICPADSDALRTLCHDGPKEEQQAFVATVSGFDREGMLHSLTHALWEADTSIFKAHVTTGLDGQVSDTFWLYDNRDELPEQHRVLEICDRITGALGPGMTCTLQSATRHAESAGEVRSRRLPCKDARSYTNLRSIVGHRSESGGSGHSSLGCLDELCGTMYGTLTPDQLDEVVVEVDRTTSVTYTMFALCCRDRKGLLYDLFLALKEIDVRVAYGSVRVARDTELVKIELFVQDANGGRIADEDLLDELKELLRNAAAFPVCIDVHDAVRGEGCDVADDVAELIIMAPIDAGCRGRPRVTYDVTQGLSAAGVGVYSAEGAVFVFSSLFLSLYTHPK